MDKLRSVFQKRWVWTLGIVAIVAFAIPHIGLAVLDYQATECSVLIDGQQQMLQGDKCDRVTP